MNKEIYVYADWPPIAQPTLVGVLRLATAKNRKHFSFSYDNNWLQSPHAQKIDPDLELAQFLTDQGANTKSDLAQLWRRMVFNIAVSIRMTTSAITGFFFGMEAGFYRPPSISIP